MTGMRFGSFRWTIIMAATAMPLCFGLPRSSPCESGACAAEPGDIVWSREIRPFASVPARVVIAGTKKEGKFTPSYVVLPDAEERAGSEPLPWLTNIMPILAARSFGQEERARISRSDDGALTLECSAGEQPAGVVLSAPDFHYPQGLRGELVIAGSSTGEISIALVDAGTDAPGTAIAQEGRSEDVLSRLSSSSWEQGKLAKQLVIGCPKKGATIHVRAIQILPKAGQKSRGLGTWLWDVMPWLDRPDSLVALARSRGVTDLFVQIRIEQGQVIDRGRVLSLIDRLAAADITVHAVEGDPEMATPAGRANALDRARVLRSLQTAAGGSLKRVQYDIEPYLLPQFDSDPARWWNEWALSVNDLARVLEDRVSVAVPFWMLTRTDGREALLKIRGSVSSVVVMAYRTEGAELEAIASRWLDWGHRQGMKIQIALENGPLPVEYHRAYTLAERGEVLLERSSAADRIVLLNHVVTGSSTRPAYWFTMETEVNPRRISFMNDRGKLNETVGRIGPNLLAWESFGGLLVHEIMIP